MIIVNENRSRLRLIGSNPPLLVLQLKEAAGTEALSAVSGMLKKIKDLQESEIKV